MPKVKKAILLVFFPAPHKYSAIAQAFASFSNFVGIFKLSEKYLTISIFFQSGKFGGQIIIPLELESGPPQLIPIFDISPYFNLYSVIISKILFKLFFI